MNPVNSVMLNTTPGFQEVLKISPYCSASLSDALSSSHIMTRIPSPVRLLDTLSVRRRRRRHRRQLAHGRLGFPNSLFTFSRRPSPSHEVTCLGPLPSFLLSYPSHGRTTHTHLRSTSALVRLRNVERGCARDPC